MTHFDFKKLHENTFAHEKQANDFLAYLKTKGLVENDDHNLAKETKVKILNLYSFFGNNPSKLREGKKNIEKELIIKESKIKKEYAKSEIKISDKDVIKIQIELYKKLGIKKETHKNNDSLEFLKGIIDVSLLQNADFLMYIKNNGTELVGKIFEELGKMSFSDLGKIFAEVLKSLGESIGDLFTGNPYEKGKSFAELGLSTAIILAIGKKVLKKQIIKQSKKIELSNLSNDVENKLKLEQKEIKTKTEIKNKETLKLSKIVNDDIANYKSKIIKILESDKNIKKLEIPNDKKTKELINQIVSENYPLIEVTRLIPGEIVTNITFSGIKKLNDNLGQDFTDKILGKLESNIKNNFKQNTSTLKEHSRIIRTNYKNLTFSSPEIDSKKIFFNSKNKEQIIDDLIKDLDTDIEVLAKKLSKSRSKIEKLIKENLDFSIGNSKLEKNALLKDKLRVFYEAEISSRRGIGKKDLETNEFDIKNIERNARKAMELENEIINNYSNRTFEFENTRYKIIVKDIDGKESINPILLRYVRKYGEDNKIKPEQLNDLVKNYINELNSGFDFISPSINLEKDLEIAKSINKGIKEGTISSDSLVYSYKQTLSKDAFFALIDGKKGMSAFIDIRDMGIDNLDDFRNIREKIVKGTLSEEELLKAGNKVTQKFINTIKSLKNIYGDRIKISLGGDEIYIFIEGVTKKEEALVLANLNKAMNRNNLKSRISHNFESDIENFAKLEKLTIINKKVEEKIEKIITKSEKESILRVPDNISLNIEKGLENLAIRNIDNIISSILNKVDKNIIEFITLPIEGKILDLGIINGLRVVFRGGKNSLMEINITKL